MGIGYLSAWVDFFGIFFSVYERSIDRLYLCIVLLGRHNVDPWGLGRELRNFSSFAKTLEYQSYDSCHNITRNDRYTSMT